LSSTAGTARHVVQVIFTVIWPAMPVPGYAMRAPG